MAKKAALICISFLLSISLLSCSGKNAKPAEDKSNNTPAPVQTEGAGKADDTAVKETDTTNKPADTGSKEEDNRKQETVKNPLEPLSEGKIDGIGYSLGTECKKVLTDLGKPDDEGTTEGNYYYMYGNVTYFSDSMDENEGNITAIAIRDSIDICGTKVGMKPAEIKKILGQPFSEGTDEGEEGWVMTYEVKKGLYLSYFSDNENSPVTAVLFASKSET